MSVYVPHETRKRAAEGLDEFVSTIEGEDRAPVLLDGRRLELVLLAGVARGAERRGVERRHRCPPHKRNRMGVTDWRAALSAATQVAVDSVRQLAALRTRTL